MYKYFCIEFIDYVLKVKILQDCTNLFSPNQHRRNDKTIHEFFQEIETNDQMINFSNDKKLNQIQLVLEFEFHSYNNISHELVGKRPAWHTQTKKFLPEKFSLPKKILILTQI